MEPTYLEALTKYQDEIRDRIMSSFSIPPELLQGGNYSSSRVALETYATSHGMKVEYTDVGGTWLGEVQSP